MVDAPGVGFVNLDRYLPLEPGLRLPAPASPSDSQGSSTRVGSLISIFIVVRPPEFARRGGFPAGLACPTRPGSFRLTPSVSFAERLVRRPEPAPRVLGRFGGSFRVGRTGVLVSGALSHMVAARSSSRAARSTTWFAGAPAARDRVRGPPTLVFGCSCRLCGRPVDVGPARPSAARASSSSRPASWAVFSAVHRATIGRQSGYSSAMSSSRRRHLREALEQSVASAEVAVVGRCGGSAAGDARHHARDCRRRQAAIVARQPFDEFPQLVFRSRLRSGHLSPPAGSSACFRIDSHTSPAVSPYPGCRYGFISSIA